MSLRSRLAILFGLVALVASGLVGVFAFRSTARELGDSTDRLPGSARRGDRAERPRLLRRRTPEPGRRRVAGARIERTASTTACPSRTTTRSSRSPAPAACSSRAAPSSPRPPRRPSCASCDPDGRQRPSSASTTSRSTASRIGWCRRRSRREASSRSPDRPVRPRPCARRCSAGSWSSPPRSHSPRPGSVGSSPRVRPPRSAGCRRLPPRSPRRATSRPMSARTIAATRSGASRRASPRCSTRWKRAAFSSIG